MFLRERTCRSFIAVHNYCAVPQHNWQKEQMGRLNPQTMPLVRFSTLVRFASVITTSPALVGVMARVEIT